MGQMNYWPATLKNQRPPTLGRAASLTALMEELKQSQWLPYESIENHQYAKLAVLAAHAAHHSPYFRERLARGGIAAQDMALYDGMKRLPLLTRGELQQVGTELYCERMPRSHFPLSEGKSSGSTGQPVTIRKTVLNQMFWCANMMREHAWHQRDFMGKTINVRAAITAAHLQNDWGYPVNILYPSAQTLNIPVTFSSRQLVDAIIEFRPSNLIIYPSTLKAVMALCEEEQVSISGLQHIWCIGETLKPELRVQASSLFGAQIEDDYSCNEVGIMALQCPESGLYHVMAESVIIEVLGEDDDPCKEGEIGKVVVTDLHNYATPMIRYDIGDYAEAGGPCPCGRGLPTLRSISGRRRNLVVKPSGDRHFPALSLAIFEANLPIRQFQLIQHSLQNVEVNLVTGRPLAAEDEAILTTALHKGLDYPFDLRFTYFEGVIPCPENGKFEEFISYV